MMKSKATTMRALTVVVLTLALLITGLPLTAMANDLGYTATFMVNEANVGKASVVPDADVPFPEGDTALANAKLDTNVYQIDYWYTTDEAAAYTGKMPGEATTFYAKVSEKIVPSEGDGGGQPLSLTAMVTYQYDGKTEQVVVDLGAPLGEGPAAPAANSAGQPFVGWYSGGARYDATTVINEDVTLVATYGNEPGAVQNKHLMYLYPKVAIADKSLTTGVNNKTKVGISGDVTLLGSGVTDLYDVYFEYETSTWSADGQRQLANTFRVTKGTDESIKVYTGTDGDNHPVSGAALAENQMVVWVPHIAGGSSSGQSTGLGMMLGYFDSITTPVDAIGKLTLTRVSCDGASITAADWEVDNKWNSENSNVTASLKAMAGTNWTLNNMSPSTAAANLSGKRYEGDLVDKTVLDYDADINKILKVTDGSLPTFKISGNATGSTTSGFVPVNNVVVTTTLEFAGNIKVPADIFKEDGSWISKDAFDAYFGLAAADGVNLADWDYVAELKADGKIYLTFSSKTAEAAAKGLSVNLSIKKIALKNAITNDAMSGTHTIKLAYVRDTTTPQNGSYYQFDNGLKGTETVVPGSKTGATFTLTIDKAKSVEDLINTELAKIFKERQSWKYNPAGYAATTEQLGNDTTTNDHRDYITPDVVTTAADGSLTVDFRRIWFAWGGTSGLSLPNAVNVVEISEAARGADHTQAQTETGYGYKSNEIKIIGVEQPDPGENTSWEIVLNGTTYTKATITAESSPFTVAPGSSPAVYMLKNPDSVNTLSIRFINNATDSPVVIGVAPPRVLYQMTDKTAKELEAMPASGKYFNYSKVSISYVNEKGVAQEPKISYPQADVPFLKTVGSESFGAKIGDNLTHTPIYDSKGNKINNTIGGDTIKYTIEVEVPEGTAVPWVDGVWVMDSNADGYLENFTNATVTITRDNGSTIKPVGASDSAATTYADVAAIVGPNTDYKISANQRVYAFEGRLYADDIITITYEATIKAGLADGTSVENKVYLRTWTEETGPGGPGGPGGVPGPDPDPEWEWTETTAKGGHKETISPRLMTGDISIQIFGQDSNASHTTYYLGDKAYLHVVGGLVSSDKDLNNPVYIVSIQDKFNFDPAYGIKGVKSYTMEIQPSGSSYVSAITGTTDLDLGDDYTIEYLDAAMNVITGTTAEELAKTRFVAITLKNKLDKATNEGLMFDVGVVAASAVDKDHVTLYSRAVLFDVNSTIAKSEDLYRNGSYRSAVFTTTSNEKTAAVKKVDGTGDADENDGAMGDYLARVKKTPVIKNQNLKGIQSYLKVTVRDVLGEVGLAKKAELPKENNITPDALYLNKKVNYTVTITPTDLGLNQTHSTSELKNATVEYIVDILPPGQTLVDGSAMFNNVKNSVTVEEQTTVRVTFDGNDYDATRVVFKLNTPYTIPFNSSTARKLTYSATLTSMAAMPVGAFSASFNNYVSIYVDSSKVNIKAANAANTANVNMKGKADAPANEADWWKWKGSDTVSGSTYVRVQAKVPVTYKMERIQPGITKSLGENTPGLGAGKNEFSNSQSAKIEFQLVVSNGSSAKVGMNGFTVIDVLPSELEIDGTETDFFTINGISGSTLAAADLTPTIYKNEGGGTVIYWQFTTDALKAVKSYDATYNGLKPDASLTIVYKTKARGGALGSPTNYAWVMPDLANQYFDNQNIAAGDYVESGSNMTHMIDVLKPDAGADDSKVLSANRSVRAEKNVILYTLIAANSHKTLTYNYSSQDPGFAGEGVLTDGDSTRSQTSGKLVSAMRGEVVDYSFNLTNKEGSQGFTNLQVFDVLPAAGDKYTQAEEGHRGSQWKLDMEWKDGDVSPFTVVVNRKDNTTKDTTTNTLDYVTGAALANAKNSFKVDYSFAADVNGLKDLTDDAKWQADTVEESYRNLITAFRISVSSDVVLGEGDTLTVHWQMRVPQDTSDSVLGTPAYNSASYRFKYDGVNYQAEPEKVGVLLEAETGMSLQILKYLYNNTGSVTETFTYLLEKYNPYRDVWEAYELKPYDATTGKGVTTTGGIVSLYNPDDANTRGKFQITAKNDGGAYGGYIQNLTAGEYRFTELDAGNYVEAYHRRSVVISDPNVAGLLYMSNGYEFFPPPPPEEPPEIPDEGEGDDGDPPVVVVTVPREPAPPAAPGGGGDADPVPGRDGPLGPGAHWSLLNLMCALFCGITAVIMLVMMAGRKLRRRKDEEEQADAAQTGTDVYDEDEQIEKRKGGFIWRVLGGVVAIAAIVAFLLTEDIRNPMIWACEWTPMMVTFAIAQVLVMLGLRQNLRRPDEEEWEEEDLSSSAN